MPHTSRKIADKALEIRMQDMLEGLADFTTRFAYQSTPGSLTILSIAPPGEPDGILATAVRAPVIPVLPRRSRDVVSFLLEREARNEHPSCRESVALTA